MRLFALSCLLPAPAILALAALAGCAPSLSQPFASLGNGTVTIYRLQNVEPPAQQAPGSVTFQIPKEVQQLISGAAALLPPGLIPPGLIPGSAPAAPPTAQDLRFHGFRVINWQTIADPAQKNEVLDILGHGSNFVPLQSTCMYAEFGFAIQPSPGAPTDDVLVSLSCGQVQAFNFTWPYSTTGISSDAAKRIVAVAAKSFAGM
jgi:hypothetical protein